MSDSPVRQWLEFAASDLAAAQALSSDGLYRHACFHAQQCIEKSLKAFLIARTNTYPRIHDLVVLLT
jgi:HEPN domain-containing protein